MCSIVLMAIDCNNFLEPHKHARLYKKWDVIAVRPDGQRWGIDGRTLPIFRIIDLPNVSVSFAESFLAEEIPATPADEGKPMRRRKFYLNLDSAVGQLKNYLNDDTRKEPRFVHNITEAQLESLRATRPSIPPP